jgi:hypothetical protein
MLWEVALRRLVFNDVAGQPTGPILEGQAVQILEHGTDKQSRNVGT